jgi:hypothetical protein
MSKRLASRSASQSYSEAASQSSTTSPDITTSHLLLLTSTKTIRFTESVSFMPTPAVIPDVSFSFSQSEIAMFTLSAFIVLAASVFSGRLLFHHSTKSSRTRRVATAIAAKRQQIELEQSRAAAKKVELDDMDVEFDDFFGDDPVAPHDPLDYLVPEHVRNDPEVMGGSFNLVEERLRKNHSVFGVPLHKAPEEVRRRVGASDLRIDRIERSMRLRSEALQTVVGGASAGNITRGLVSETNGIDLMHTTPQVLPVSDLGDLPWLNASEVEAIRNAQTIERRQMIEHSGRDPEKALSERTTLDLALDGSSPLADNLTSVSRYRKPDTTDRRSNVTESVLRTSHRAGDLVSNASFLVSDPQRRGSLHQRVMQNALDAASASDIGSSNGSFYGHRSSLSLRAASAGRSQEPQTWDDVGRKGGSSAVLYQFSHSPMERMRMVRDRVEAGPLRGVGASYGSAVVVAPTATAEMQRSTQYLPDPDEDTFVGIDLDYRLTDADL